MNLQYLQAAPAQHATTTDNAIPLLQPTSKRSQLLPTSYYSFLSSLSTTTNSISSILLPTTYYLPTYYYLFSFSLPYLPPKIFSTLLLPTIYLYLLSISTYYLSLPTYLLLFLYRFAPLLPAALLTTHNYYYLPTTPKLSYISTFFHF